MHWRLNEWRLAEGNAENIQSNDKTTKANNIYSKEAPPHRSWDMLACALACLPVCLLVFVFV